MNSCLLCVLLCSLVWISNRWNTFWHTFLMELWEESLFFLNAPQGYIDFKIISSSCVSILTSPAPAEDFSFSLHGIEWPSPTFSAPSPNLSLWVRSRKLPVAVGHVSSNSRFQRYVNTLFGNIGSKQTTTTQTTITKKRNGSFHHTYLLVHFDSSWNYFTGLNAVRYFLFVANSVNIGNSNNNNHTTSTVVKGNPNYPPYSSKGSFGGGS